MGYRDLWQSDDELDRERRGLRDKWPGMSWDEEDRVRDIDRELKYREDRREEKRNEEARNEEARQERAAWERERMRQEYERDSEEESDANHS